MKPFLKLLLVLLLYQPSLSVLLDIASALKPLNGVDVENSVNVYRRLHQLDQRLGHNELSHHTSLRYTDHVNTSQIKIYHMVSHLYNQYRLQHNIHVIANESLHDFCQRKFLIGGYDSSSYSHNCQGGIGNEMGAILSNFVAAVLLNRTFVWVQEEPSGCDHWFQINSWIPTGSKLIEYDLDLQDFPIKCKEFNNSFSNDFYRAESCNSTNSDNYRINPDYFHHNSIYDIFTTTFDPYLSQETVYRSSKLFHKTFADNARFFSYGFADLSVFNFSRTIKALSNAVLTDTLKENKSIRISMHIRHYEIKDANTAAIEAVDVTFMKALETLRRSLNPELKCFIYLASEKEITLTRIKEFSNNIKCSAYTVNHSEKYYNKSSLQVDDHGKFGEGILPFADLYLLRHGDYFIGSNYSTFSHMIANIVALQGLRKGLNNPLIWVDIYGKINDYYSNIRYDASHTCRDNYFFFGEF